MCFRMSWDSELAIDVKVYVNVTGDLHPCFSPCVQLITGPELVKQNRTAEQIIISDEQSIKLGRVLSSTAKVRNSTQSGIPTTLIILYLLKYSPQHLSHASHVGLQKCENAHFTRFSCFIGRSGGVLCSYFCRILWQLHKAGKTWVPLSLTCFCGSDNEGSAVLLIVWLCECAITLVVCR